jgi:phospholipid/cholesterol/gamma-HCH transport system permease protein
VTSEPQAAPADADAPEEPEEPRPLGTVDKLANALFDALLAPFVEIGALFTMLWQPLLHAALPPYRFRLLFAAAEFIGVGSIFIVGLTGFFIGALLSLQMVDGFREFGAQSQTGAVVGIALSREIAPVFTALMVSSRAGSAITTELGSMRVTSQIDALVAMAVNPIQYLVAPRVVAGLLTVPILVILFDVIGMFGAYLVGVHLMGLDPGVFMDRMRWLVDWDDVRQGLIKAAIFGFTVALIACRQGFYASGGAAGVGQATNRSVVHSAIAILTLDYLVTAIVLGEGLG